MSITTFLHMNYSAPTASVCKDNEKDLVVFRSCDTIFVVRPRPRPRAHPAAFRGRRFAQSICRDLRFWMLSAPVRAIRNTQPPLNGPAQQTVNIIGILTPSRCGQVCKIVNKKHDGATAHCHIEWKSLLLLAII